MSLFDCNLIFQQLPSHINIITVFSHFHLCFIVVVFHKCTVFMASVFYISINTSCTNCQLLTFCLPLLQVMLHIMAMMMLHIKHWHGFHIIDSNTRERERERVSTVAAAVCKVINNLGMKILIWSASNLTDFSNDLIDFQYSPLPLNCLDVESYQIYIGI